MKKQKAMLLIDAGYHGFKVKTYTKGEVDRFNMPAQVCISRGSTLFNQIEDTKEIGLIYKAKDGTVYKVGEQATAALTNQKFRKHNEGISSQDKSFYALGDGRFTSNMFDVCIFSAMSLAAKRLVDKGLISDFNSLEIEILGVILPHDIIINPDDKTVDSVDKTVNAPKYISVSFDNGKEYTDIEFNTSNGISIKTTMVASQAESALFNALLEEDGTPKKFTDSDGNEYDIAIEPDYILPCAIFDIGKRTAKVIGLEDLNTIEETNEVDAKKYAMYNIDALVAKEMNEFFENTDEEDEIKPEDIDPLISKNRGIFRMTGKAFDITESRKRAAKTLAPKFYKEIKDLDNKKFFRTKNFVFFVGGGAMLMYSEFSELIKKDYPYINLVLCDEELEDGTRSSVYSVVEGLFKQIVNSTPDILETLK